MKWIKKGLIFNPSLTHPHKWMYEYALAPHTLILGDRIRVFFSCRPKREKDGQVKSYSSYVDISKSNFSIIKISNKPICKLGQLGAFDEFGVVATSSVILNNKLLMYYIGWTRMQSVPYATAIGVLESNDYGLNFRRISNGGPIITSTINEPFREQACPIVRNYENKLHMWYMTGLKWIKDEELNKIEPVYKIVHAISNDGINWQREGVPIISQVYEDECQTTPSVFLFDNIYHMFFSYRHALEFRENKTRSYRIGYAYSRDLKQWIRDDTKVGITVSENGWDSEMICYPHVFELNGKVYMFYNGNNFGKDGFGYAELEI